jgi:hypothetical protein
MMQVRWIFICFIFAACLSNPLSAGSSLPVDTTRADSVTKIEPSFKNVNVLVETEWGSTDKREGVDVYVKVKGKKPYEIEMRKGELQKCCVTLMSGVTVKILDPKTGRVLKKY